MSAGYQHLETLRSALAYAQLLKCWVVVVVNKSTLVPCAVFDLVCALAPEGASAGGRTMLLPGGGRLTVTLAEQQVPATNYHVVFLDKERASSAEVALHWESWATEAKSVLALSERNNMLVSL